MSSNSSVRIFKILDRGVVTLVLCAGVFTHGAVRADVKPAVVFADHLVLQRDVPACIWGTASATEQVVVEFAGQKKTAIADAQGNWRVSLDPLSASAEARTMSVSGATSRSPFKIRDVLVGDVWICAGGIHVANRMNNLLPDVKAAVAAAKAEPAAPNLRLFAVNLKTASSVQPDVEGRWLVAEAGSMHTLPAEGYYLGRKLISELGVPIGIVSIAMAWPGQPIEAWTSREALVANPAARPILDYYASDAWRMRTVGTYEQRLKAWMEYCQKLPLNPPPKPLPNDSVTLPKQEPAAVWNAMVAPLARLTVCGVVWDHGEDDGSLQHAVQYGQLLPAMIGCWREAMGKPKLPFTVVQLRPLFRAKPWGFDSRLAAELRDSQREAASVAKASVVVLIDLPADPHPREVCPRIADTLLAKVYKKGRMIVDGPELDGVETLGNKVILRFRNTQGGLVAKGGVLKGFAVASSMFRWVWADATIQGDTVVVSAPTVDRPDGVRYAYQDFPERGANLVNGAGCPAAPLRTDNHLTVSGAALDPGSRRLGYNARCDLGIEDPRLPRILIIGDSISGHYLYGVRERMRGRANVIGESSMTKGTWASMGPLFYRADWASKGDGLKRFLVERGPFAIVHFNNGIHNFARAQPGDEVPYAGQLRKVVATIRESGAVAIFANSTGTIGDNMIPAAPRYLTNCVAFNTAAEKVMRELGVPVTDIYGATQPRVKELISADLIHFKAEADPIMIEAIVARLNQALDDLSARR